MKTKLFILIAVFSFSTFIPAQRPPRGAGFPEWAKIIDVNRNGRIEQEEYRAAADDFFKKLDRNGNGVLEENEMPPKPAPDCPPMPPRDVPPFVFLERGEFNLTKAEFDEKVNLKFISVDMNGDRTIDGEEIKAVRPPAEKPFPNAATAQFVGAEMFFGDKTIKNAPFSAETVREESKRLFDGSLVKNEGRGLIFRDGEGRIRQEVPFEKIGGFPVLGRDNQPIRLVQIIDSAAGEAYSLNTQSKRYFKIPLLQKPPLEQKDAEQNGKEESLGTRTIEGVQAEGTRTTIEIPAGQIGNDKPIYVVTERWFSPELQTVVLSKHVDPFAGEVVFRLVNIKPGEPSAELFKVPKDYKFFDARTDRGN